MTTENLEGIEEMIAARAARTAQWRQRAADLLRDREQLEAERAAAEADAAMELRATRQYFADKAVPLDEEIGQVVHIVSGPAVVEPEPVAPAPEPEPVEPAPAVVVTPEPVAPASAPEPEPIPEPTATAPLAVTPPATAENVNVVVAYSRWVRGWRLIEWILALLLAFIAFKVSGDYQDFGFRTGFWSQVQHFFWRAGWTIIGFTVGGFIGMYFARPFGQRAVTTYRTNRATPAA